MNLSRSAFYNLTGSIVPLFLAVLTVPLYIHLVGTDRYGVLAIAFLFLGYFGLFDLGLGKAVTYRLASLRDARAQQRSDVLWTAIAVNLGMGLIGGLILWGGAYIFFSHYFQVQEDLRQEILVSLPLLAACLPVATLTGVLSGALQADHRFFETNLISVLSTTLFQLLPILVAWQFGPGLSGLLAAALVARSTAIIVLLVRCAAVYSRNLKPRYVGEEVTLLLGFGGWILADGLLSPILAMVDRFAIGAVLGASAVTIYTVPYQLAQRITIFPSALLLALFPHLPTASAERRKKAAEESTRVLLAAISLPIAIAMLLAKLFFTFWLGHKVGQPASEVAVLVLMGFWLNALAWAPLVIMQATGRPDLVTKAHIVQVVPYLLMLYIALQYFGLLGVSFVFILRNLMDLVLLSSIAGQQRSLRWVALFLAAEAVVCYTALSASPFSMVWNIAILISVVGIGALSWWILPKELAQVIKLKLSRRSSEPNAA